MSSRSFAILEFGIAAKEGKERKKKTADERRSPQISFLASTTILVLEVVLPLPLEVIGSNRNLNRLRITLICVYLRSSAVRFFFAFFALFCGYFGIWGSIG
jgi:hypothetical protein